MSEQTWTFVDRSRWGSGPWDNEPDKIEWRDVATGLPCIVRRGGGGAWCGYVAVPLGHPWYGGYTDLDVDVHGGITYAEKCMEKEDGTGVCHVPQAGEPDDVWWLGFDCSHYRDRVPAYSLSPDDVYRTVEFVRSETTRLAAQIGRAAA